MSRVITDSLVLDSFDATEGWTVLGNDTTNLSLLAANEAHVTGKRGVKFDKANGAANTVYAGIYKTRTPPVSLGRGDSAPLGVDPLDSLRLCCYLSSLSNVVNVFVRLGTDATHYSVWKALAADLTAGRYTTIVWDLADVDPVCVGDGWNPDRLSYMVVGVEFAAESDTLTGIRMDHLSYVRTLAVRS